MTTSTLTAAHSQPRDAAWRQPKQDGRWWRFGLLLVVTAVTLAPLAGTVSSALGLNNPGVAGLGQSWVTTIGQSIRFTLQGPASYWFENSLMLAFSTVVVCIALGAPAGYVLARGRGRAVSGFALVIFLLQSFPVVLLLVPLFLLLAKVHLVDDLFGLGLVYVALSLSVAIWMFSAYVATVPIELEEAAWLDGCSVFGGFFRVILRNSLPAVLTTAIFTFLFVWNDYIAAYTFIRSNENYTVGIGLQAAGHSPILAVLVGLPPVLIFAVLNRYFSIGGVAGALSAR